jgi:hypothetical protein
MAVDPKRLKARNEALKGARLPHENVWRDCFDHSMPELGSGFSGQDKTATELQTERARLLDGTAADALDVLADGFMYGMTPSHSLWFALDIGQESHEERRWLDEAATTCWEQIHASNFDAEAHDAYKTMGVAGWFVLFEDWDESKRRLYFEQWPISECAITASRPGYKVDTIFREFSMSAGALAEWAKEKGGTVSQQVQDMVANGKQDESVTLLWAIEPRAGHVPGSKVASRLPFSSVTMELQTLHVIKESGFHEFPCSVPRWMRLPKSCYATGPMSRALADVKSLQEVKRWEFAAAETAIAPPMKVKDDGVLNPRTVKLGPRKLIVVNDMDSIEPLVTGARVEFGQMVASELQAAIRRPLMADLFQQLLEDPRMTATQVNAILQVIRQRIGPRFSRMQSEYLAVIVERTYSLLLRAGVLGQPPESMLDADYSVRYESPLAKAQKLVEVAAMDQFEAGLLAKAQVVPTALDGYDWAESGRHRAKLLGVPLRLVLDAKAVAKKQQAREAAMQRQQQQQIAMEAQGAGMTKMAEAVAGA